MKQRRESYDLSPSHECFAVGEEVDLGMAIPFMSDDVEDAAREFHHAERMLEAAVRCSGVDEGCQRELVDVTKTLKGPRVDRGYFVGCDAEVVNRVTDLMLMLRHGCKAS